ncbi:hypothetical protein IscW_ISCW021611 [Ixodes scapularis]|uniref:Uncharacterized protein n=1 Tax=Ixodes scapularis TaxID=6945 RepID=B7Q8Q6_IXOSC|nr:hypothetical protein IscW_ISCW021611 [Ixodes scapularis]|eukprot:XP_002412408.1 hypothetical protein IscW_ISCW021611 [Ixodes scapularis]
MADVSRLQGESETRVGHVKAVKTSRSLLGFGPAQDVQAKERSQPRAGGSGK